MARSRYILILIKSSKGLEIVSSLQHWAENVLEMFVIQKDSTILIVLRIQKK